MSDYTLSIHIEGPDGKMYPYEKVHHVAADNPDDARLRVRDLVSKLELPAVRTISFSKNNTIIVYLAHPLKTVLPEGTHNVWVRPPGDTTKIR